MGLEYPHWVAADTAGSRQETAALLVGTAKENGLVVRYHIRSTGAGTGYWISDTLADLVYEDEPEDVSGNEPEPEPEPTTPKKKSSGNRAGNTNS